MGATEMKRSIGFALLILALWASMSLALVSGTLLLPMPTTVEAQSGFVCAVDSAHNSARFNSAGQFTIDAVGHSEVAGNAQVLSSNPLVLSFHSTEDNARIAVVDGFGLISVSIAHGDTVTFGGQTQPCDSMPAQHFYIGNADGIICEAVYGWAADMERPSQSITVGVYVDGVKKEDVLASLHRQDVANWLQSLGFPDNGNHGFAVPWPIRDGLSHQVSVRFEQSNTELGSSPRVATCAPFSAEAAQAEFAETLDRLMEKWNK
jgi:hypothetical protein